MFHRWDVYNINKQSSASGDAHGTPRRRRDLENVYIREVEWGTWGNNELNKLIFPIGAPVLPKKPSRIRCIAVPLKRGLESMCPSATTRSVVLGLPYLRCCATRTAVNSFRIAICAGSAG